MAIVRKARFRPDINKSTQETLNEGLDPEKGEGTVILTAQLVAYEDTTYNPATAVPGRPDDEAWVQVIAQAPLSVDVRGLAGKTQAEINTFLATALRNWAATVAPVAPVLVRIRRGARQIGMIDV